MTSNLSFLRVLDMSNSVAGQFCARLFADHGADVALIELPGGTPTRAQESLFWHLNCGKHSLVLDPAKDTKRFAALLAAVDVLVLDQASAKFSADLSAYPGLVFCSLSDFGENGPYAGWVGGEIVQQSYSGLAYGTGRPDDEPLFGFGNRASYSAGIAAHATTLAALVERDRSGLGQSVRVSAAETGVAMSQNLITLYSYNETFARRGVYEGPLGCYACTDGQIVLFVTSGRWRAVCEVFGLHGLHDDPRFTDSKSLAHNWPVASELIAEVARTRSARQLVDAAQALRLPVSLVMSVADVRDCADLAARGYWTNVPTPAGPRTRLGPIARMDSLSSLPNVPAPELGAGGDVISATWRGQPAVMPASGVRRKPLAGVRVIELTTAWAGPMAGRTLAFFGAEVIKVESGGKPDAWRGGTKGDVRRYPDCEPGERPYNRSGWFNTQNHDKRSIELDLKTDAGQVAVRALMAKSDVVICNLAPGALRRLGLDYGALTTLRADIVLLEISSFGSGGPFSSHVGVGPTVEATTASMRLFGYADGLPQSTGSAYIDPIGGITGASMVLTALLARHRSGAGAHIEVSLREAALQWVGEYLVGYDEPGATPTSIGNASPDASPHGIYPAEGQDEWLALAVHTAAQWEALCAVIGTPAWAANPAFATIAGRRAQAEQINASIAAWSRQRDKQLAAMELQSHGIAAAPVNNGRDLHDDAHLAANGFFHTFDHPEAGTHRYQGLPFHLDATPGELSRPAPLLAADTGDVLRTVLGWSEAQIAALGSKSLVARR